MPQPNLTTLDNVKAWLNVIATTDDQLLYRLIGQVSRVILSYIQRPNIFLQSYSDVYDGAGRGRQILRNFPILSVSSLTIGSQVIPAAASYGQAGYTLEPWDGFPPGRNQAINLSGYEFCQGLGNVAVTYLAGYAIQKEPQSVPATAPYSLQVNAPYGIWGADSGVTYANGTPLTLVAASPSAGQYTASGGIYTFAAADQGRAVLISYSYIPSDLEQACNDIVAERYRYRDRIGQTSKSLGGQETMAYSLKDLPDYVKMALQSYCSVLLI